MTASSESNSLQAVSTTTSSASKSQPFFSNVWFALDEHSVSMAEQSVAKLEQSFTKSMRAVSKVLFHPLLTLVITTYELLAITKTIRTASTTGDLFTAEKILTQEITANAKNFASYANRFFVLAHKLDWDNALKDANKLVDDGRKAFDLAFMFTHGNMDATAFLYLIKAGLFVRLAYFTLHYVFQAIALFNANRHKESPRSLMFVRRLMGLHFEHQASLRLKLGTIAFNGAHHSEAIEHFTAAVKASTFLAKSAAPAACEAFTVLFGWDIESLWETSNKQLILALLRAGKLGEAFESYRFAMTASDKATRLAGSSLLRCNERSLIFLSIPTSPYPLYLTL
ncbi:uncharacterized protein F5147DRAFT_820941 [Suillus discolor]|uniref:Uncharacterized protein n=1 Tax=Suillus discolor TaxID=1912936 RepID=A0A9P7JNG3_9AGAM|nr:uncharacterized protein F5147DRAFT_820941 [Suillus discolor]KAG2093760.1 hypothetical protein F5147DRAFT_820941 [Suillus discolor]